MLLFALSAAAAFVGPAPAARPVHVAPRARVMRACDAAGPPALRLSGTVPGDEAAAWLGLYRRARPGPVAGRPAYQNTNLPNRWLVWTGVEWVCELEADLPWSNMCAPEERDHKLRTHGSTHTRGTRTPRGRAQVRLGHAIALRRLRRGRWVPPPRCRRAFARRRVHRLEREGAARCTPVCPLHHAPPPHQARDHPSAHFQARRGRTRH